jgi:hypothetical protein
VGRMGAINFNLIELICKMLKAIGFKKVKKLSRLGQDAYVYARDGSFVIPHGPYVVKGKPAKEIKKAVRSTVKQIQDEFEDYLRKIAKEIDKLRISMPPKSILIIFQGGGRLVLPTWFLNWAEEIGIKIRIISDGDPEEIDSVIKDLM